MSPAQTSFLAPEPRAPSLPRPVVPSPPPPGDRVVGRVSRQVYPNRHRDPGGVAFRVVVVNVEGRDESWIGEIGPVAEGSVVEGYGTREPDKRRPGQEVLRVVAVMPVVEQSTDAIIAYLSSGAIPHIRGATAKAIVKAFGDKTLDVLDKAPWRLAEVKGIKPGSAKLDKIIAAWTERRSAATSMIWLCGHGISASVARRIVEEYGAKAVETVQENPYRLAVDVDGIGFATADGIAKRVGIAEDSPHRAEAAVVQALHDASSKGHCYMERPDLAQAAADMIDLPSTTRTEEAIRSLLVTERVFGRPLAGGGVALFPRRLANAEERVAKRIAALLAAKPKHVIGADKIAEAVAAFEARTKMQLAPAQREAVELAATSQVLVLTGGPGTGKTASTRAILALLAAAEIDVTLCAPTGKAAQRMTELTGHPAATIHSTLSFDQETKGFLYRLDKPLPAPAIIVDEASMVDLSLAASFLEAVDLGAKLIIVGDVDQLPSVGPGAVLRDLIASAAVPTVRLSQIFRQAAGSSIIVNAHRINRGETPIGDEGKGGQFYVFPPVKLAPGEPKPDGEAVQRAAADLVVKLATERIPAGFGIDARTEVLVLTPMHKGHAGTIALNERLRDVLNPASAEKVEHKRGEVTFRMGDRVLETKNDSQRGVCNGDVGFLQAIETTDDGVTLTVRFGERVVPYVGKKIGTLKLAYALSVHKSQGSQSMAVVVVMLSSHFIMLSRPLIYTAVTRSERLCCLVAEPRAIRVALDETKREDRRTMLAERLREAVRSK